MLRENNLKRHSYKQLSRLNNCFTALVRFVLQLMFFTYHFNTYLLPRRFLFIIEGADAHSDLYRFSLSHNLFLLRFD